MHNPDAPNWLHGVQAVAVARYATAHNDGETVLEWHSENGIVDLKMSSGPRAKEAMQAFLDEGWETMFGINDMGQWIHVRSSK